MSEKVFEENYGQHRIVVFEDEEQGLFRARIERVDGNPIISGGETVQRAVRGNFTALDIAVADAKNAVDKGAVK